MKKIIIVIIGLSVAAKGFSQDAKMDAFINNLMSKMTIDQKIGQLNLPTIGMAVTGPILSKDVEQKIKDGLVGAVLNTHGVAAVRKLQDLAVKGPGLKIPLLFGLDVIHGHTTMFPIPLAMSCSWDTALIEKSARIAAEESTADGLNWTFSPMVDITRDPRWGRIAEGAGEDPYWGSLVARAMVKGYQQGDLSKKNSILACVKHFALYGAAEAGRDYNTVDMSKIKMYQYYLPPYKAAVDAGVGSLMSSFNEINGLPSTANKWLFTDLLRDQWGYKGFTVSDYTAINELINHGLGDLQTVSALALTAGIDMDMVGEGYLTTLKKSLNKGKINEKEINDACRRILEIKYKLGLFDNPYKNLEDTTSYKKIFTQENKDESKKIAEHSFVLLKNDNGVLPLRNTGTIALIGPLANNKRDMFGPHQAAGQWQDNVSVMEGFQNIKGINVLYAKGANITDDSILMSRISDDVEVDKKSPQQMIDEAVATANKADVVVAVLGESQGMSGEASSRSDINIPESQENLLKALVATGKPVVLVLMNGRPLTIPWEDAHVSAILESWFGGTEEGNAVADVLFGNYNPSGKLTISFPRNIGQIPIYYNHKNTGRPDTLPNKKYKSIYLDVENTPLYPFGYGLSYTTFSYSDISLNKKILKGDETLTATVSVTNTGKYAGEETVQLYISDPVASITRSVEDLKGFQKIFLQPGESKNVTFKITIEDLKFWNNYLKYDWEAGEFVVHIGTNSAETKSASVNWEK
jgi:beta-glucosidase